MLFARCTSLEMDSNEERIAIALRKQKEQEAAEERKRMQKEISMQRKERERMMGSGRSISGGFGGGGMGSGIGSGSGGYSDQPQLQKEAAPAPAPVRKPRSGGMKLSKKSEDKGDDLMAQMMAEGAISSGSRGRKAGGPGPSAGPSSPIELVISETVDVQMNRDGGLETFEVKGDLTLTVTDQDSAQLRVEVELVRMEAVVNFVFVNTLR